ncbi:aminotransferase class IV [bacterium]|nr:aminotransferase class IV [bacterium]
MNRGFLYGDGFFESIRVTKGSIPLIQFHLERIYDAIEILKLKPQFDINEEFLLSTIKPKEMLEARVRINFFREGGGKYLPESNEIAFNLSSTEISEPMFLPQTMDLLEELRKAPALSANYGYYPEAKPMHSIYSIKTLSSAFYVLAALYKQEHELEYLFIKNSEGEVLEELSSNIILVKNGECFIGSEDNGMVYGACLRFMKAAYGFQIKETIITEQMIDHADELYISRGSFGIRRIK